MASNAPQVDLGRIRLTERNLKALEMLLYRIADMRDRILADGLPYTQAYEDEVVLQKEGA